MTWTIWDILVVVLFVLNLAAMGVVVFFALRLKKPVTWAKGRIPPLVAHGKAIAQTGKREFDQNRHRVESLAGEVKGLAAAVKPAAVTPAPDPRLRFNYRSLLSALALLRALGAGVRRARAVAGPAANPPGPASAKHKAGARSRLQTVRDLVGLFFDIRRELRRG